MTSPQTSPQGTADTVTRFAPSPTGLLHLGHAYSAWYAWQAARCGGGRALLRIEDIDTTRCRTEFEATIAEDLAWLGLDWDGPVWRQSDRFDVYRAALAELDGRGLLYPCFCTRKEIREEIARAGSAPHPGADAADGPVYPGTCRRLPAVERQARLAAGEPHVLRLDMAAAVAAAVAAAGPLTWQDAQAGLQTARPEASGDIVLAGKEVPASYHLCVVVDDAAQGVTRVTRGLDLFTASHVHRLLYALFGWPVPLWDHHRLVTDAAGKRLAKRTDAVAIRTLRAQGLAPAEVWRLAGVDAPPRPIA